MGDSGSLVVNGIVVAGIQIGRLGIVMCFYNIGLLCSSVSSDRAAEPSLNWDPFVTMNPQLRHSIDGDVSRGMSGVEKVVEFDSGA